MILSSLTFLLFLAITTALYWILPRRARLLMLLAASLTFYGFWRIAFLPVMLVSAATDYLVSLRLSVTKNAWGRRALLAVSLTINLGLLFYFKYLMFFMDNAQGLASNLGIDWRSPDLQIILPLGISFYAFQTISYTVDVYRGFIRPERDPVLYTTYVTVLPQTVLNRSTGGLDRAVEMTPQVQATCSSSPRSEQSSGQQQKQVARTKALFLTWALMRFWHGAAWKFVVWGLYHAVLVYVHRRVAPLGGRLSGRVRDVLGWAITLPLAMLAWIPFRAPDLSATLTLWGKIFEPSGYTWLGMPENTYLMTALLLLVTCVAYGLQRPLSWLRLRRPWLDVTVPAAGTAIAAGSVFIFLRPISQFIYFQF